MPLKSKYQAKDQIPADQLPYYVERDGVFLLDAEGVVEKSKFDEVRNSNDSLVKERDELKHRFEGIDPIEVRKLAEDKRRLEEEKQIKAGEVDKVIEARIKAVKGEKVSKRCQSQPKKVSVPANGENASPSQLKAPTAKESGGGNPLNKLIGYASNPAGNLNGRTNNV